MASSAPAVLSDKDQELFKKADRLFQKKLYKQAMKNCELILKKNEKHGETVALKAAIMGRMAETDEQKQDAIDLCKRGVQLDLSCKNSWVHLARMYKAAMRYDDAIKSFKMALRLAKQQPDKNEFRRELTHLLAQTRNWQELADTRRQLQLDNREMIIHWIGYSVALYLAKNYTLALTVWREFCKSPPPSFSDKELMEMYLFEARILEESGDLKGALTFLQGLKSSINPGGRDEICGRLELALGMYEAAEKRFWGLVKDRNTENYDYHRGLQCAISQDNKVFKHGGLSLPMNAQSPPALIERVLKAYDELAAGLPKSMACHRIPLDFCKEEDFIPRADNFLRNNLRRGVPCLFTVMKPLYRSRPDLAPRELGLIVNKRIDELKATESDDAKKEKGFALYFLAQHLDFLDPGCDKALDVIQEAIDLDKVNPDFLRCKARILKHGGDYLGGFEVMDTARQLELNDRYLNNKAAKYALRADKPDTALALTHLFTRGEDVHSLPDPAILHDLQCMWFELETAASAARSGDVIFALKNYHWVETHFNQIRDDEFDFHEYCVRRFVLNSYVNLVRMEDRLRTAPAFKKMVKGAVECWLQVFDLGKGLAELEKYEKAEKAAKKAAESETDESQFAGMTPSEKKRAMKKIKQEKQEKERADLAKKLDEQKKLLASAAATSPASGKQEGGEEEDEEAGGEEGTPAVEDKQADLGALGGNRPPRRRADLPPDPDPKGFKRFALLCKDPLKQASQLMELALQSNADDAELHLINFGLQMRKHDFSAAWKSLEKAAAQLGGWTKPTVLERFVPFARFAAVGTIVPTSPYTKSYKNDLSFKLDEETKKSLDQVTASLPKPPIELAQASLSSSDSEAILAAANALLHAQVEADTAIKALLNIVKPMKACLRAQYILNRKDPALGKEHMQRAKAAWPRARGFAS